MSVRDKGEFMDSKDIPSIEEQKFKRPLLLMLVINAYFWLKLIDYIGLYTWSIGNSTFLQLAALSLNIPVYFAALFYIFKIRVGPQIFWKVWMVIAIADEARMSLIDYSGIADFIEFTGPVIPIYIIGVMYAYYSQGIWTGQNNLASENP
jgi:hypothetical protein